MKTLMAILIAGFGFAAFAWANPAALASPQGTTATGPQVLIGFQEWKKNQIFDARMNLDQFKSPQLSKEAAEATEGAATPSDRPAATQETKEASAENTATAVEPKKAEDLPADEFADEIADEPAANPQEEIAIDKKAEKLRQLEFNLEIAKGLTIHDYFALYLKNKSKEEMAQVIRQLSPEELSELLMAYRKSLYGLPEVPVNAEASLNKPEQSQ